MARRLALPLAVLLASNIYAMPLLGRAPHFAEVGGPTHWESIDRQGCVDPGHR